MFSALDLNSDGTIEMYEFMTMYYYIENFKDQKDLKRVADIFKANCDFEDKISNERAFSRNKFVQIALDNEWYSEEKM